MSGRYGRLRRCAFALPSDGLGPGQLQQKICGAPPHECLRLDVPWISVSAGGVLLETPAKKKS